jgi:bacillithiol biosynthesis deacetylase BshB1
MKPVDVVAFGAHPDDVEIGCGGAVAKLTDAGKRVAIVDLTRGELGTRGDAEIRAREAAEAARILGVTARENLGLPDGHIRADIESKRAVVEAVRRLRPESVLLPYWRDRHPDHDSASALIYEAAFLSGLRRFETGQKSHRPTRLFYFVGWSDFEPTFIVDITAQFDRKMEAVDAFATQFRASASPDPETDLTSPRADWRIRSRCAYYGSLIGERYGEGFVIRGELRMEDPLQAGFRTF